MGDDDLATRLADWFAVSARNLPWREDPEPWAVLVSEVMLAQTPVARVLPIWQEWLHRWPTPAALAVASPAEALRGWGRLGYPRRALRLHEAAGVIVERFGGEVPRSYEQLLELPGVGDYTAAAVVSFAFDGRAVVLDVNVRRLFARVFDGEAAPPAHIRRAERLRAESLLPQARPADWAAATMELGALVCTARTPDCPKCPIADQCAWLQSGRPGLGLATTRRQTFEGTDRQVRGVVMAALRASLEPVEQSYLDTLWHDPQQLARAIDSLMADGLVDAVTPGRLSFPG